MIVLCLTVSLIRIDRGVAGYTPNGRAHLVETRLCGIGDKGSTKTSVPAFAFVPLAERYPRTVSIAGTEII